jgi:hypothetical protein
MFRRYPVSSSVTLYAPSAHNFGALDAVVGRPISKKNPSSLSMLFESLICGFTDFVFDPLLLGSLHLGTVIF